MIVIRECLCCGDEFATGVFGFRCDKCQDQLVFTTDGIKGTRHKPCRVSTTGEWKQYNVKAKEKGGEER